jgi:hypothetical protein
VPVPVSEIVSGELGELLVIEMLPLALPATVGVKVAVKDVFKPALIVNGVDRPVMLKPVPETLAAEMVMLAVPEFVSVIVCVPLLPRTTLPKLTGEGLAARVP